jgi:hypothetical protein
MVTRLVWKNTHFDPINAYVNLPLENSSLKMWATTEIKKTITQWQKFAQYGHPIWASYP